MARDTQKTIEAANYSDKQFTPEQAFCAAMIFRAIYDYVEASRLINENPRNRFRSVQRGLNMQRLRVESYNWLSETFTYKPRLFSLQFCLQALTDEPSKARKNILKICELSIAEKTEARNIFILVHRVITKRFAEKMF